MIKSNQAMNIALSPLNLSPNNYIQNKQKKQPTPISTIKVNKSPLKQMPKDKSIRQQTKDKINNLLFKDDMEDDSFIFKDEADSDIDMFKEDKKRGEIVSPNNLTVGED
jgi:hypothetical protein